MIPKPKLHETTEDRRMWPDHNPKKTIVMRVVATLIVMSFVVGAGLEYGSVGEIVAGVAFLAGASLIGSNLISLWKMRGDPYDLTKLRLVDDKVERERERAERAVLYCHRCDISAPDNYSICPQCGCHLGT